MSENDPKEPDRPPDVAMPAAPESGELQEHWDDLREALKLDRMPEDDLRKFVDDFVSGRIFTSAHIRTEQASLLPMIFMPLALGAFSKVNPDSLSQIGCLYEYYDKAGPRSINGFPMFFSFHLLHVDDWERAKAAIEKEEERRKGIEV